MVVSEKLYSPQSFLEAAIGKTCIADGDNDIDFIEAVLKRKGCAGAHYALGDIENVVERGVSVALVDCMIYDDDTYRYHHEYVWFETPGSFREVDDEKFD